MRDRPSHTTRGWRRYVAATAALGVAIAGCTAGTPEEQAGETDQAAEGSDGATTPAGVFVHAVNGEPLTLDPARAALGEFGEQAILQVYEGLLDVGADGPDLLPLLATEVPDETNGLISDDGLVYTFPIREGVVFHDGSELTADDVLYSWERSMTMALPEGQAEVLSDTVESMRVVDDFTFEVTLQAPNAAFLTSVVYSTPAMIVSQEAVEANGGVEAGQPNAYMDANMVGTGAHRFVSWERNEQLNFEIFADYWGDPAALDARWVYVPEESSRTLGLRAGDYDAIQAQPTFVPELENADGVCLITDGLLLEPLQLAFNLDIQEGTLPSGDTIPADFFHDRRIRQAFNYAFDYDAFINGFLDGFGEPAGILPPGILGWTEDMPVYEQDLGRAEELFRDTGYWDEGFTVSVLVEANPVFEPVGLILKDALEAMNPNFRVNVLTVSESQFDEAHATVPFEYAAWIKNADPFQDPAFYIGTYQAPYGEWGETMGFHLGYDDPDGIQEMIDAAATETDIAERERMYIELVEILHEDPMWIYPAQEGNVQAYRCNVEGFTYNPLWKTLRYRFYDKA
ncbi:MAG: ABC transporter substrate-binding protein [Actinobacteria bacterium]|jgi:peptide/nickel transport system substrate-binding protein|nr:ABC transporter substrate-binding protein [Actinomycetota bacterium]